MLSFWKHMLRQLLSSIYLASHESFQLQDGLLWKAPGYLSAQVSTKNQWSWVSLVETSEAGFHILPLVHFLARDGVQVTSPPWLSIS